MTMGVSQSHVLLENGEGTRAGKGFNLGKWSGGERGKRKANGEKLVVRLLGY